MKISKNLVIVLATLLLLIALPLTIYLVRQQQIFKPKADVGDVVFTLTPQTSSVTVGQDLAVDLGIAAGTTDIEAILLTLRYDPAVLRLDSFDSSNVLGSDLKNDITATSSGALVYEAVDTRGAGTAKVKGTFKVGTLRFRAVNTTTTPTQVTFVRALVGNSTATSAINTIKPTGQYTITATGSALGNITVNVFADKDRDGTNDIGEPYVSGMRVSLAGTASRGPLTTDQNGGVNFTALTAGSYTVSLNLTNSDLEVLNPAALNVNLTSGSASTQIRVGPKSSVTPVTGAGGGPTFTYTNGASSPAWYSGTLSGRNLEKLEIFRVRNSSNANIIANPSNWIPVLSNFPCANENTCVNNNTSIGVWENITNADIGEWIVFINGYSYSGQKCTGNPFVGNALLAGFTDCGNNDVVTTVVAGSGGGIPSVSPSSSATIQQMPTPNAAVVTANGCLSGPVTGTAVLIQWVNNNTRAVEYVDISTQANFASYYHKTDASFANLNAHTSTYAPEGFNGFQGVSGALTMNPSTTYYIRLFDGTRHSSTISITPPLCPASSPINQCPAGQILCARTGSCMTTAACNATPSPSASTAGCTQSNGDANRDGRVNGIDFTIWSNEFLSNTVNQADFNCDGRVNGIDFTIWSNAFLAQ